MSETIAETATEWEARISAEVWMEFRQRMHRLTREVRALQEEQATRRQEYVRRRQERKEAQARLELAIEDDQGRSDLEFATSVRQLNTAVLAAQEAEREAKQAWKVAIVRQQAAQQELRQTISNYMQPLPLFDRAPEEPDRPQSPAGSRTAIVDGEEFLIEPIEKVLADDAALDEREHAGDIRDADFAVAPDPLDAPLASLGLRDVVRQKFEADEFATVRDVREFAAMESSGVAEAFGRYLKDVEDGLHVACCLSAYLANHGVNSCRVCGCTQDSCEVCVEKTGQPCCRVEANLCSACTVAVKLTDFDYAAMHSNALAAAEAAGDRRAASELRARKSQSDIQEKIKTAREKKPAKGKPAEPKPYACDVVVKLLAGGEEKRTYVASSEKQARRKALLVRGTAEVVSITGMDEESYRRVHGYGRR